MVHAIPDDGNDIINLTSLASSPADKPSTIHNSLIDDLSTIYHVSSSPTHDFLHETKFSTNKNIAHINIDSCKK